MTAPKQIPPASLAGCWAIEEIELAIPKLRKLCELYDFDGAAKLWSSMMIRAKAADMLFKRAAYDFSFMKKGQEPPGGIYQPDFGDFQIKKVELK